MTEPPWVSWSRTLPPDRWIEWRRRADAILAREYGLTGGLWKAWDRSLEAAWREMVQETPPASNGSPTALYAVLDLETGGLDPEACAICSVAVMTLDHALNEVKRYHRLIADEPEKSYTPDAMAVNGLDPEKLRSKGTPVAQVIEELTLGLKGKTVIAHNATFDLRFLAVRGIEVPESICTLELSRRLHPRERSHKLGEVARRLGVEQGPAHDALGDVITTANVFRALKRMTVRD